MILKYGIPIVAVLLAGFTTVHVVRNYPPETDSGPSLAPAVSPFDHVLSVTGVVEGYPANVAVAAPVPGVVAEVCVAVGKKVKAGAPLFRLDGRSLRADLLVRQARLATSRAQLARLETGPRQEEITASAARVAAARAALAREKARLERGERLLRDRLTGALEVEELRQTLTATRELMLRAQAEDRLLRTGSSEADRSVARAAVAEARALVAQGETELDRLTVRAPSAGTVLQLNVREGEAVGRGEVPPVVLGGTQPLTVRVEIDAHLAGQFDPAAPARAVPRGRPGVEFPLRLLRVEPLVVLKRQFTGDPSERSDTRVLQVIYTLDPGRQKLYPGQSVDVFVASRRQE